MEGTKTVRMLDLAAEIADLQQLVEIINNALVAPKTARLNEARAELQAEMVEHGIKTLDAAGGQFVRRVTRSLEITDEAEFIAALSEAGMLDDCLRLDKTIAKRAAKGREMPGTAMVERESFAVSLGKRGTE